VTVVDNAGLLDFAAGAEFSLAAWVRASAAQEDGAGVIARGSGGGGEQYAIDIFGGTFRFFVRSEAGAAQVAQGPVGGNGSWQHVVAVYSRTLNRMKLYVNKAEVASSVPFFTGLLANSHELSIGARQLSTTDYNLNLNGAVDDVRVYGRALTPSDIAALYDQAPLLAPSVVQEPQATFTGVGGTARFTVGVEGTVPLTYQWRKGGTPIDGATNVSLTITNAQLVDEGDYSVVVINSQGQATSAEAHLTVIPFLNLVGAPVQASSLFNASFPAAGAFDGLKQSTGPNTARWASTSSVGPPHWIYVDLGQERLIRRVAVDWETAGGRDFTLRVRRDAQGASGNPDDWTTVAAVTGYNQTVQGIDGTDVLCDFTQSQILMPGNTSASATTLVNQSVVAARYLMLHVTAVVGTFVHVSVWEIQVDGVPIRARIQPLTLGSNGATLNFDGAGGLSYEVQRSTTVIGGWSPLTTIQTSASGAGTYTDPTPLQPNGFYRVVYP
jgi:hypothetical protein